MKINFNLKKNLYYILTVLLIIEIVPYSIFPASAGTEPTGIAVDAVDSFRITHVYDPNLIYIEWKNGNPDITGTGELISGEQVRLYLDWSVKEIGTVKPGDYFTFTFPDVFEHAWIETKNNIDITHPEDGTVMAQYSVRKTEDNEKKELIVIFTDGIIGRENITGKYELVMFIGQFEAKTETSMSFEINGNTITTNNGITGNPAAPPAYIERGDAKWGGRASLEQVIDGYYYFKWTIWLNFNFETIDNFFIDDTIPLNSPHVLITPQTVANLGINIPDNLNHLYHMTIREYIGADELQWDSYRYNQFQEHLNNIGGWYENYMVQYTFDASSSASSPELIAGIDSGEGVNLNNFTFSPNGKGFSANMGRVTRPIVIDYYTITTQPFSVNAFYDDATASIMKNSVVLNGNATKSSRIYAIWVDESASIGGVYGNYSFTVKKSDENNLGLAGALFGLYTSPDCEENADRIAQSQDDGTVTFSNLKTGIYYIKEVEPPEGYMLTDTIYKVELTNTTCTITAPDDLVITEIINYTNTPEKIEDEDETEKETEVATQKETKKESDNKIPYIPPLAEIATESTTTTATTTVPAEEMTAVPTEETITLSTTEATVTEPPIIEEPMEIIIPADEEIITVPEMPDDYLAEQLDNDLYQIYDNSGVPLGGLTFPEEESIDELNYENIIDNLIPLGKPELSEEPTIDLQAPAVQPEPNPRTSDLNYLIPLIFILSSLAFLRMRKFSARRKHRISQ